MTTDDGLKGLTDAQELIDGIKEWARFGTKYIGNVSVADLLAHLAANVQPSSDLSKIGELVRTQNNRITEQPIFIVQQKIKFFGVELCNTTGVMWTDESGGESSQCDDAETARLEAEYQDTFTEPKGFKRYEYEEHWEFVQACFTEQGCKDYIERDGHNLREPRIYATGSYRNREWQTVRNWLKQLPPTSKEST